MNNEQAKRLVLAIKGTEILAAELQPIFDNLSESDSTRILDAMRDLGVDMLRRAGFNPAQDGIPDGGTIIGTILGTPIVPDEFPTLEPFRR